MKHTSQECGFHHRFMDRSLSTIEEFYNYRSYMAFTSRNEKIILCANFMEHTSHKRGTNHRTSIQNTKYNLMDMGCNGIDITNENLLLKKTNCLIIFY